MGVNPATVCAVVDEAMLPGGGLNDAETAHAPSI
jgi:hypothetical protein